MEARYFLSYSSSKSPKVLIFQGANPLFNLGSLSIITKKYITANQVIQRLDKNFK